MNKLVVLSALLALAAAKPTGLVSPIIAPSLYGSIASPALLPGLAAAPLISGSPLISSYSSNIISSPLGVPLLSSQLALAPNSPANVISANGVPLDTIDVVNARNAHYTAKVLNAHGIHKRSAVLPLGYSSLIAPAISSSSRIDIPSGRALIAGPAISAYSAPLLSSPLLSSPLGSPALLSSPLVSAYNAPLISSRIW